MATIFISHAGADRGVAADVAQFLRSEGVREVYLDFHHELGTPVGAAWEADLFDKLKRANVVIALVSRPSIASQWCFAERAIARLRQRPLVPIYLSRDVAHAGFDHQGVFWGEAPAKDMLSRFVRELLRSEWTFQPEPGASPFPGFRCFEARDAGYFFGRDDEIDALMGAVLEASAIAELREKKALTVIGPSGSGKSSLVRAGVLPRFGAAIYAKRFRVGAPVRPSSVGPDALSSMFEQSGLELADFYHAEVALSASASGAHEPDRYFSTLITIDQFEEILGLEMSLREALLAAVTRVLNVPGFQILLTARSDTIAQIQSLDLLRGRLSLFGVDPLNAASIEQIIIAPARLAGIEVSSGLLDRMVKDANTPDALPLLASTLSQMFEFDPGARSWDVEDYDRLGEPGRGLSPIATAVSRIGDRVALGGARPPTALESDGLRTAFVRHLTDINDAGEFVRRKVERDSLPPSASRLIAALIEARLLVADEVNGKAVIEVAHEALLRSWPLVNGWLREEAVTIQLWANVRRAASQWVNAPQASKHNFLLHGGASYDSVSALVAGANDGSADVAAYLKECAASNAEHFERQHQDRTATLNFVVLIPLLIVVLLCLAPLVVPPDFQAFDLVLLAGSAWAVSTAFHLMRLYQQFDDRGPEGGRPPPLRFEAEIHRAPVGALTGRLLFLAGQAVVLGTLFLLFHFAAASSASLLGDVVAEVIRSGNVVAAPFWRTLADWPLLQEEFRVAVAAVIGVSLTLVCMWLITLFSAWIIAVWEFFVALTARIAEAGALSSAHVLAGRKAEADTLRIAHVESGESALGGVVRVLVLVGVLAPSAMLVWEFWLLTIVPLTRRFDPVTSPFLAIAILVALILIVVVNGSHVIEGFMARRRGWRDNAIARSMGLSWLGERSAGVDDAALRDRSFAVEAALLGGVAFAFSFALVLFLEWLLLSGRGGVLTDGASSGFAQTEAGVFLTRFWGALTAEQQIWLAASLLWAAGGLSFSREIAIGAGKALVALTELPSKIVLAYSGAVLDMSVLGRAVRSALTMRPMPSAWLSAVAGTFGALRCHAYGVLVSNLHWRKKHSDAAALARLRLAAAERLLVANDRSVFVRSLVVVCRLSLVEMLYFAANYAAAAEQAAIAASECEAMTSADPQAVFPRTNYAWAQIWLGHALGATGDEACEASYRSVVAIDADVLREVAPRWTDAWRGWAAAFNLARRMDVAKRFVEAVELYSTAVALVRYAASTGASYDERKNLYLTILRLGQARLAAGDPSGAIANMREARKVHDASARAGAGISIDAIEIDFALARASEDRVAIIRARDELRKILASNTMSTKQWMNELLAVNDRT